MDPDDGLDEEEHRLRWLPPDDRLWRHPSELAAGATDPTASAADEAVTDGPGAARAASRSARSAGAGTVTITSRSGATTLLSARELDRRIWAVALLAGVVGALIASGAGAMVGEFHHSTTVVRPIEQVVQSNPFVTIASNPKSDVVVDIAARMRPTIVELLVTSNGTNANGSGVIFTSDGYILTNDHVVSDAQSVVAVLSDGRKVKCRLIGSDRDTDIAVVKLQDTKPQTAAVLGGSTQLKVGQLAIAIGSPLGLAGGPSVTSGIISAVDRQVHPASGPALLDMIQTDAAIEPGSSGGALVDAGGMVIGITTAIGFGDQSLQPLGFATPIEVARDVANQILSTGKVAHAWLGLQGTDVDVATAQNLNITGGATIGGFDSYSPASRSGMATTDVVIAFGGQTVYSMSALEMNIRQHRPGDRITISYIHRGEIHSADVTLVERPASDYP